MGCAPTGQSSAPLLLDFLPTSMIKLLFTDMSICFEPIQKCGGKGNGCDVVFRYGHDLGSRRGGGLLRRSVARRLGGF